MTGNRKLIKSNLRGHRSETTERNERLRIWLTFWSGLITAAVSVFFAR